MTTLLNNPGTDGGGGMSATVVALAVGIVIVGALFVAYRIPVANGPARDAENGAMVGVPMRVDIDAHGRTADSATLQGRHYHSRNKKPVWESYYGSSSAAWQGGSHR